jgi:hypothetical protein
MILVRYRSGALATTAGAPRLRSSRDLGHGRIPPRFRGLAGEISLSCRLG